MPVSSEVLVKLDPYLFKQWFTTLQYFLQLKIPIIVPNQNGPHKYIFL